MGLDALLLYIAHARSVSNAASTDDPYLPRTLKFGGKRAVISFLSRGVLTELRLQILMSLTKRAVAASGGVGATPTSSRAVSLSQKKRGTAVGEHHAKGADAKVSESGHAKIKKKL